MDFETAAVMQRETYRYLLYRRTVCLSASWTAQSRSYLDSSPPYLDRSLALHPFEHSCRAVHKNGNAVRGGDERKSLDASKAGQGKARQGKARQGKARQGKARQGKASRHTHHKKRQQRIHANNARIKKKHALRTGIRLLAFAFGAPGHRDHVAPLCADGSSIRHASKFGNRRRTVPIRLPSGFCLLSFQRRPSPAGAFH
jgi:hypothetical protein